MISRLLALLAVFSLVGCDETTDPQNWPPPSPAIWEVTAPGGEQAWLMGTVHALPDGLEWRTTKLEEVLARSKTLIVEIAKPGSGNGARHFATLAESSGLAPLSARIAESDRPALEALLNRADAQENDFARIETWAAALTLASAIRQGGPANGVDKALVDWANGEFGVAVEPLETIEQQYAMFDNLPDSAQSALLAAIAREAEAQTARASLEAWLTGDIEQLAQIDSGGMLADPNLHEALLASRNALWAEIIIIAIVENRRPLVAVGAAHMLGEDGLVATLEDRGLAVTRIQ